MILLRDSTRQNCTEEDSAAAHLLLTSIKLRPINGTPSTLNQRTDVPGDKPIVYIQSSYRVGDKENVETASLTVGSDKNQAACKNGDDYDDEDINAALQLLSLKPTTQNGALLLQQKNVRFNESVQAYEFERCIPLPRKPAKRTLRYELGLSMTLTQTYTTVLNDVGRHPARSLNKFDVIPVEERCRLQVAHVGMEEVLHGIVQLRPRTTDGMMKTLEKKLNDFISGASLTPP